MSLCCVCPGATPKRLPQKYLWPVHLPSQRISRTKPKPRISLKTANLAVGLGRLRAYPGLVLYEPKGGIWVSEKNEYPSCDMNSPLHAQKSIYFSSPPLHFSPSNQDLLSGQAAVALYNYHWLLCLYDRLFTAVKALMSFHVSCHQKAGRTKDVKCFPKNSKENLLYSYYGLIRYGQVRFLLDCTTWKVN